jgi:3-mercaptopyruvate sulfurtransferase SseA
MDRLGYNEYLKERIPDSTFFSIQEVSMNKNHIPHMLPSKADFEKLIFFIFEGSLSDGD